MNIMVIEPGPNNGTIGCGGSIAKYIFKGANVYMVPVTYGDAPNLQFSPEEFRILREKEARAAAMILGIPQDNLHFLGHEVFAISVGVATQQIMTLLREIKPDICYIPSPGGNHPDYLATFQAAKTALSFSGGRYFKSFGISLDSWFVPRVLIYEVSAPFRSPQYYEVISKEDMGKKKEALIAHTSQTDSRRYDKSSYHLNRYRAIMSGLDAMFCEAFEIWRADAL